MCRPLRLLLPEGSRRLGPRVMIPGAGLPGTTMLRWVWRVTRPSVAAFLRLLVAESPTRPSSLNLV